jgi:hypothetical protein
MTYQNDDDDDTLIYDSGPSKALLWKEILWLRDRVRELESRLYQFEKSDKYFGDK